MKREKRGVLIFGIGLFLVLFLLLCMSGESSAIGIVGNNLNVMLEFESGLEKTFTYGVMVTNPNVENYETFAVDELTKYITVEPRYLKFDKSQGGTPSFIAILKLPKDDKEIGAGKHCAGIGVTEMTPKNPPEGEGMSIVSRTSAKARVCVRVLYEGKYIKTKLNIPNTNENSIVRPEVEVSSWGKEDINSVHADIFIYDINGTEIKTIRTNSAGLKSKAKINLEGVFDTTGIKPGGYKAKAIVYYDGKTIETSEIGFKIGTLYVEVVNYTREIIKGKINKFEIKTESRWNNKIEDVSGEIIIGNQDIKTVLISLEPWAQGVLEGYVDAGSFDISKMPVRIIIYYADAKTTVDGIVNVIKDPNAGKFAWFKNLNTTIVLIIILIILIEVIWIIGKKFGYGKRNDYNKKFNRIKFNYLNLKKNKKKKNKKK